MSASARVKQKVETRNDRLIKTEIDPETGWILVEGAWTHTIIQRFNVSERYSQWPFHEQNPRDAIRFRITRDGSGIELSIDRERGGKWWPQDNLPTIDIRFEHAHEDPHSKLRIVARGGDLPYGETIVLGTMDILPLASSPHARPSQE